MPQNKFAGMTDAELQKELERRKRTTSETPKPLAKPDFSRLKETVVSCVEDSHKEDWWNEDNKQFIFEAAVQAVYGPDYFKWHNQRFR